MTSQSLKPEAVLRRAVDSGEVRSTTRKERGRRFPLRRLRQSGRSSAQEIYSSFIASARSSSPKKAAFFRPSTVTDGVENLLRGPGTSAVSRIARLEESCYLCRRIGDSAGKMLDNAAWLWEADEAFRKKTRAQKCLCLPHTRAWLEAGKKNLAKKQYAAFCKEVGDVCNAYFDALRSDVSKYCRKFDYRYEDEPWGEAKDAPERAIRFLVSDRHSPLPEKKKQT